MILTAADNPQVRRLVSKHGMRLGGSRFVAGETMEDSVRALRGLNEKGLAVAIFYFPGYAEYPEVRDADVARAIAPWELATYLLGNCADVREAVPSMEAFYSDKNTYNGVTYASLKAIDTGMAANTTLKVAAISTGGYCIDATVGGKSSYFVGPGGTMQEGGTAPTGCP